MVEEEELGAEEEKEEVEELAVLEPALLSLTRFWGVLDDSAVVEGEGGTIEVWGGCGGGGRIG